MSEQFPEPGPDLDASAFAEPMLGEPVESSASSVALHLNPPTPIREATAANDRFCPRCNSTRVRRASRSTSFDKLVRLFFIAPFRCRKCHCKFYRF